MGCWLVDKLSYQDNGGQDGGHEADGPNDDVQVGEGHPDQGEQQQEQGQNKDSHPYHQMQRHHPHVVECDKVWNLLVVVAEGSPVILFLLW